MDAAGGKLNCGGKRFGIGAKKEGLNRGGFREVDLGVSVMDSALLVGGFL